MTWTSLLSELVLPLGLALLLLLLATRVVRLVRDPRRLATALSADVQRSLREAGVELEALSRGEVQLPPALRARLVRDVQRAFLRQLVGVGQHGPMADGRANVPTVPTTPPAPELRAGDRSFGPGPLQLVLAALALAAAGLLVLYR